ncbi:lysophospholipid acyltransferase family protein [Evansella cellulosilytica]|uniref:Phospholipid/glycerol acyltransferase n=1 Tax=Evansella cellulosilytica (strain ATCC 21833 / DSM 2522 / FERM P-1141 / JCM 9156 / N-4) TaxID=649639 RepID=E6TWG0_EVAC2|nr:lysophospholipid acyltransferase family protein [Evansella cellulosilytica]ADU32223.1 phospholipid/glycerol acyltransferase [Evansella cellulosilytica DSM 2522]
MIKAERSVLFEHMFSVYNKHLLRKHFHCIYLARRGEKRAGPAIYLVNHSSWWDPLVLFYLNHAVLKENAVAMMSEDGLTRFPFFRKIGAFSVNRQARKSIMTSLQYASEQLKEGKSVFLFPQGEEVHIEKRPLTFFSGAAYLVEKQPSLPVIPISFYHSFFHHQLAEWFISIGKPISIPQRATRKEITALFEKKMTFELDHLRTLAMTEQIDDFQLILHGKSGISEKLESCKQLFKRR